MLSLTVYVQYLYPHQLNEDYWRAISTVPSKGVAKQVKRFGSPELSEFVKTCERFERRRLYGNLPPTVESLSFEIMEYFFPDKLGSVGRKTWMKNYRNPNSELTQSTEATQAHGFALWLLGK